MRDEKETVYVDSEGRVTSYGATMGQIIAAWLEYRWERICRETR